MVCERNVDAGIAMMCLRTSLLMYWLASLARASTSSFCDRVMERNMYMEENPAALSIFVAPDTVDGHVVSLVHNESALDVMLDKIGQVKFESNLEPHFRSMYKLFAKDAEVPKSVASTRLAVLLSGQARTMLELEVAADYSSLVREWSLTYGHVEVFAYLDTSDQGSMKQRHEGSHPGVRASLQRWGVPFALEEHADPSESLGSSHPDFEAAGCDPIDDKHGSQVLQFAKVQAATDMMKQSEKAHGESFDVIVRMRPDMCIGSARRFLEFALKRTTRSTMVPFLVYDTMAVYPRWAADAYASAWRTFGPNCDIEIAWASSETPSTCNARTCLEPSGEISQNDRKCLSGGGDLMSHLTVLGVGGLDMHWFWGGSSRSYDGVQEDEPKIRRTNACTVFA